jgi:tRNA(Arg) A34 adenosine deaminase TadA
MVLVLPEFVPRKGFAATMDTEPIVQLSSTSDSLFIDRAFEMRRQAVSTGDQGYGALLVRDNIIVGQAPSKVIVNSDPTAHAEMQAIRDTASRLGSRDLSGCTLYSSSRACPMCEAAAFWAGIDRMVYGKEATDAGHPSLCR